MTINYNGDYAGRVVYEDSASYVVMEVDPYKRGGFRQVKYYKDIPGSHAPDTAPPVIMDRGTVTTPTQSARDIQVGGQHYKNKAMQPWDIIDAWGLDFYEGNVLKYLLRAKYKNGVEDLKKARHYLDKKIEDANAS